MNKKRRKIIQENQVSKIETFSLGGYNQKVLIEGKSKANPLLVFIHGGPGGPLPFCVGARGLFPEFTEHFIMVYWDQLGSGINDYPIDESFTIEHFVRMTVDLIHCLKKEFPDNPLLLFGTSWGSVLTAKAALRVPDCIDCVLVSGQILKNLLFNAEVFGTLLSLNTLSNRAKKQVKLLQAKREYTVSDIRYIAKIMMKKTDGYTNKSSKKAPMGAFILGLLTSPDYSLKNFFALVKNGFSKNRSIWKELLSIDLSDTLRNIKIPYCIIQGDTDIVTSTKQISNFVSENKNINLRILPNCGHIPGADAFEALLSEVIDCLKFKLFRSANVKQTNE